MRALSVAAALAAAAFATAAAAQPKRPACPTVEVTGPGVMDARPFDVVAMVTGGDPAVTPTYNWTISAGVIESGQGTPKITINPEGASFTTATVEVGGFDRDCATAASFSVTWEG